MRHPQVEAQKITGTTVTSLRKMPAAKAAAKLQALAETNSQRLLELVRSVGAQPRSTRILRLGSGVWPMADHEEFAEYPLAAAKTGLTYVRRLAQDLDVRLSFHPPAFNVLASENAQTVERTVCTLNMVGEQSELLGVQNVVVHCWGRLGPQVFAERLSLLDERVRSRLVVENDEFGVGTHELLNSPNFPCPIVLDPHHHWIHMGAWPGLEVYQAVRATWPEGTHPKIHYSYPRTSDATEGWPEWTGNRTEMRAHHDGYPNLEMNRWVLQTCAALGFDIMCESKHKDVASTALWRQALALGLVTR